MFGVSKPSHTKTCFKLSSSFEAKTRWQHQLPMQRLGLLVCLQD